MAQALPKFIRAPYALSDHSRGCGCRHVRRRVVEEEDVRPRDVQFFDDDLEHSRLRLGQTHVAGDELPLELAVHRIPKSAHVDRVGVAEAGQPVLRPQLLEQG